ncbi:MAG: STAS domain-containing protein [Deltaproteobacteria bacterium]|nr:STAS domain-containing protein [Deltaproteobacteria bacterium]NNK84812.1 STAS domain-containing protein [Desulfobacterales bacterium]
MMIKGGEISANLHSFTPGYKIMRELRLIAEHSNRGNAMSPSETYQISLAKLGAVTLFDINENMTAFSESWFNYAYQQAVGQKTKKILFKFNHGAYINSAGIAIFIQIIAQTIKRNQVIGITGLSRHFVKVFNILGITKFAKIYDNVQMAVEALNA